MAMYVLKIFIIRKGKSVPPSKLFATIDTLTVAVYTVNPGS